MSDKCVSERWARLTGLSEVHDKQEVFFRGKRAEGLEPVIVIKESDLEKKATEWEEDAAIDRENGDFKWAAEKMAIASELRSLIPFSKESETENE